jgi:N-glycosylase/DNA lyase
MKITEENNRVIIGEVSDFHLDHTFDNGQCFRWNREADGSYTGVAFGRVVNIDYQGNTIILNNATVQDFNDIWKNYLDLDRDYGAVKEHLSQKDAAMEKAISYGGGMRVLQQEHWETLISFIISQNNNIPRIKKCVENLCTNYGIPLDLYKGRQYYSFPSAAALAKLTAEELDTCRLGYRAKYIVETARLVMSDEGRTLTGLRDAGAEEAYEYLLSLSGVGPKVANCIMLFALCRYDSFPLDVWIKRVMNQIYHIEEGNVKKMKAYAAEYFGEYGGIAQQYLFYYVRESSRAKVQKVQEEDSKC